MIVFVPAYDEQTRANLDCLRPFIPGNALIESAATAANLTQVVAASSSDAALLFWSHGAHEGVRGQDKAIALGASQLAQLSPRRTYAFACHTGTSFGREASERGWQWWGYTGAISAPGDHPNEQRILGSAMWRVAEIFLGCEGDPRTGALGEIRRTAERCAEHLDELGPDVDVDSYVCARHLWSRLRVWLPGFDEELAPDGAERGLLL